MSEQHYIERYWRDATPADAIKEPPMVARFQDNDYGFWVIGELIYWDRSEVPWYREEDVGYECCQVYDAPDPGKGWRLIDVEKETPRVGDEFSFYSGSQFGWLLIVDSVQTNWSQKTFYRRRIKPPQPKYEPFRWEDREQLRGRLITFVDHNRTVEFRCESFEVDDNMFTVNNAYADWLCKHAVFVDTKEPVGKKVTR